MERWDHVASLLCNQQPPQVHSYSSLKHLSDFSLDTLFSAILLSSLSSTFLGIILRPFFGLNYSWQTMLMARDVYGIGFLSRVLSSACKSSHLDIIESSDLLIINAQVLFLTQAQHNTNMQRHCTQDNLI